MSSPNVAIPAASILVEQLLRSEKGTDEGTRLSKALSDCVFGDVFMKLNFLDTAKRDQCYKMLNISNEDQLHFQKILDAGLPYFIANAFSGNMALLREFQRTFWDEARAAWDPAPGEQIARRLLMVAYRHWQVHPDCNGAVRWGSRTRHLRGAKPHHPQCPC